MEVGACPLTQVCTIALQLGRELIGGRDFLSYEVALPGGLGGPLFAKNADGCRLSLNFDVVIAPQENVSELDGEAHDFLVSGRYKRPIPATVLADLFAPVNHKCVQFDRVYFTV